MTSTSAWGNSRSIRTARLITSGSAAAYTPVTSRTRPECLRYCTARSAVLESLRLAVSPPEHEYILPAFLLVFGRPATVGWAASTPAGCRYIGPSRTCELGRFPL